MENRKLNAETNSHGNKLSTRTNAFHQLFHQRQQPTTLSIFKHPKRHSQEKNQSPNYVVGMSINQHGMGAILL